MEIQKPARIHAIPAGSFYVVIHGQHRFSCSLEAGLDVVQDFTMAHACSGICVDVGVLLGSDSGPAPSEVDLSFNAVLLQDAFNNLCRFLISEGEMGGNLAAALQQAIGAQCSDQVLELSDRSAGYMLHSGHVNLLVFQYVLHCNHPLYLKRPAGALLFYAFYDLLQSKATIIYRLSMSNLIEVIIDFI